MNTTPEQCATCHVFAGCPYIENIGEYCRKYVGINHTKNKTMMGQIWKYNLKPERGYQNFWMPEESYILTLQLQDGIPTIWAKVLTRGDGEVMKEVLLKTVFTGEDIDRPLPYVGTYQLNGLVYHVMGA